MTSGPTQSERDRERLLFLLRTKSYRQQEIVLSSGKKSNFYIDCKSVTLDAEGLELIGRALLELIASHEKSAQEKIGGVGGLTLGADPIAAAVSLTSSLEKRPMP